MKKSFVFLSDEKHYEENKDEIDNCLCFVFGQDPYEVRLNYNPILADCIFLCKGSDVDGIEIFQKYNIRVIDEDILMLMIHGHYNVALSLIIKRGRNIEDFLIPPSLK